MHFYSIALYVSLKSVGKEPSINSTIFAAPTNTCANMYANALLPCDLTE